MEGQSTNSDSRLPTSSSGVELTESHDASEVRIPVEASPAPANGAPGYGCTVPPQEAEALPPTAPKHSYASTSPKHRVAPFYSFTKKTKHFVLWCMDGLNFISLIISLIMLADDSSDVVIASVVVGGLSQTVMHSQYGVCKFLNNKDYYAMVEKIRASMGVLVDGEDLDATSMYRVVANVMSFPYLIFALVAGLACKMHNATQKKGDKIKNGFTIGVGLGLLALSCLIQYVIIMSSIWTSLLYSLYVIVVEELYFSHISKSTLLGMLTRVLTAGLLEMTMNVV